MQQIRTEASRIKWLERDKRLFFVGAGQDYRQCLDRSLLDNSDVLAITLRTGCKPKEGPWCNFSKFVKRPAHCHYRYLLHLPGTSGSFSSRLKYLLACSAIVII